MVIYHVFFNEKSLFIKHIYKENETKIECIVYIEKQQLKKFHSHTIFVLYPGKKAQNTFRKLSWMHILKENMLRNIYGIKLSQYLEK